MSPPITTTVTCNSRNVDNKLLSTLCWTISRFISCINDVHESSYFEVRSSKCKMGLPLIGNSITEDVEIQFKMKFLGRDNDVIEIYYLTTHYIFMKCNMYVRQSRHNKFEIAQHDYHTVKPNRWQYLQKIFKEDIFQDQAKFFCDVPYGLKLEFIFTAHFKSPDNDSVSIDLCNDYLQLFDNQLFTDAEIKSKDGKTFKVHKAILATRNPVLKAHFAHDTKEKWTNCITSMFDAVVLKEVLRFIYCNRCPRLYEMPERILAAADFYQMEKLKVLCGNFLRKELTVDNAIATLKLAITYSSPKLKKSVLDFIKNDEPQTIINSQDWINETSVDVIQSIYVHVIGHTPDDPDFITLPQSEYMLQ